MDISSVMASTSAAQTSTSDTSTAKPTTNLANEQVFLRMLVAQIQNQDPLKPTDGVQYMTQLAQFSQLEQLIGIRQDLEAAATPASTNATNSTTAA